MLKLVNINCYYGLVHVLKNVSIHVNKGEIVTLIGANGAGKSTTLRSISGLHTIKNGKIEFNGETISDLTADKIVKHGISHVPEGRQIFRPMTVFENLELGGYLVYKSDGRKKLFTLIEKQFKLFPILEDRKNQLAGTLSGGEQQMLAIAMALMCNPSLLLLDEPSMGLAPLVIKEIFSTIKKLQEMNQLTVLLIEQNARAALKIADRGYVIETGKIIIQENADALLNNQEVKRAYLGKEKREIWE